MRNLERAGDSIRRVIHQSGGTAAKRLLPHENTNQDGVVACMRMQVQLKLWGDDLGQLHYT